MAGANCVRQAAPDAHFVQFYKADEPLLNRNAARFLWDGLLRGDGLLVIATRQRREDLSSHLERLGADVALAEREGQLAMRDAHETLAQIMVSGRPDWERFECAVGQDLRFARPRTPKAGVCAYGEMVGVLWETGRQEAAILLEECWNRLLSRGGMKLFCGYPIDVFGNGFHRDGVHDVLCAHGHFLSAGPNGDLADAVNRAIGDLLGGRADGIRSSMRAYGDDTLPEGESAILWLRSNVPDRADEIIARARSYYEESRGSADSNPNSLLIV
jgi:hypothetical protein